MNNIHDTYRAIAREFDHTRYKSWPLIIEFINSLDTSSKILDIGCGNGRNMTIRQDLDVYGCDFCPEFVNICREKKLNVVEADCRQLPFNDNTFDASMCIAVIHHLQIKEDRIKAIREMIRVLKPSGKILIYVWSTTCVDNQSDKIKKKFHKLDQENNYNVLWTSKNGTIYSRYYHLFEKEELVNLILDNIKDSVKIENIILDHDNWSILLQKNTLD